MPTFLLVQKYVAGSYWYSNFALAIIVSLFLDFLLYGPVLLLRQIRSSGTRGYFMLRVVVSVLMFIVIAVAVMYFGNLSSKEEGWARFAILSIAAVASFYVNYRISCQEKEEPPPGA
jgi:hypothetical protein